MGGRGGVGKLGSNGILRGLGYKKGRHFANSLVDAINNGTPIGKVKAQLLMKINPNRVLKYKDDRYHTNCALCTTALVLNQRGYDVEAMPRDTKTWRGTTTIFDVNWNDYTSYVVGKDVAFFTNFHSSYWDYVSAKSNPNIMPNSSSMAQVNYIIKTMQTWGKGSYADLSVSWRGTNSGHSMFLFCDSKGVVHLFDGQVGKIYSTPKEIVDNVFKGRVSLKETMLMRCDNLKFKSGIEKELRKMVKKSSLSKGGKKS